MTTIIKPGVGGVLHYLPYNAYSLTHFNHKHPQEVNVTGISLSKEWEMESWGPPIVQGQSVIGGESQNQDLALCPMSLPTGLVGS